MPNMSTTILAAALIFAASAPSRSETGVQIESDKFSKLVKFEGVVFGKHSLLGTNYFHHVRSWVDRDTGVAQHQLYVNILYADGRRGYDRAANDDAQDMSVTRISFEKDRGCTGLCSYSETIGIDLPESLMEAKAASGFQIKLYSHSGDSLILDIPPAEITAQLQAIDAYRHPGAKPSGTAMPSPAPPPPFGVEFGKPWGSTRGAVAGWITGNSVASRSGLHWADIITEWDGHTIASVADIQAQLQLVKAGEKITYRALRGGTMHELTAEF